MTFALIGARVFDGSVFLDNTAVLIEGNRIAAVQLQSTLSSSVKTIQLNGGLLAPGFIDVQVNGGGGALLNNEPNEQSVRSIAESHRQHGTVGLLPTVITDTPQVIANAIAAIRAARASGVPGVLGIHIEGPFLDPQKKGAHEAQFIRPLQESDIQQLANADCGKVMLTVAPNCVSPTDVNRLVAAGVKVSLGHSDATYAEARLALDAGASSFTHLFNAMSQLSGREPGMVGAALTDNGSFIGIIADGYHVHDSSLKLALAATSTDRFMLVSDAMPTAAGGPDQFELQGRVVKRVGDRLTLSDGTLAGSNLTMDAAVRYCVNALGVDVATALRMASLNPARFLGLHTEIGHISVGAKASLVHLDNDLNVKQTWIDGQ